MGPPDLPGVGPALFRAPDEFPRARRRHTPRDPRPAIPVPRSPSRDPRPAIPVPRSPSRDPRPAIPVPRFRGGTGPASCAAVRTSPAQAARTLCGPDRSVTLFIGR
ncbi:hypothetical protein ACE1SV_02230 [Streptomyces sp. E-15]